MLRQWFNTTYKETEKCIKRILFKPKIKDDTDIIFSKIKQEILEVAEQTRKEIITINNIVNETTVEKEINWMNNYFGNSRSLAHISLK